VDEEDDEADGDEEGGGAASSAAAMGIAPNQSGTERQPGWVQLGSTSLAEARRMCSVGAVAEYLAEYAPSGEPTVWLCLITKIKVRVVEVKWLREVEGVVRQGRFHAWVARGDFQDPLHLFLLRGTPLRDLSGLRGSDLRDASRANGVFIAEERLRLRGLLQAYAETGANPCSGTLAPSSTTLLTVVRRPGEGTGRRTRRRSCSSS